MKKHQIIFFLILPFSGFTINFADLEVDPRTKQQIADSFALEQSIRQATEAQSRTGAVVTVGGDNACDYRVGTTKIQDAINAHTSVEIRIAQNDVYNENLSINDNNVSLRGGYANCTQARNNIFSSLDSRTMIEGVEGAKNPVVKIVGNTQRNTIVLERLFLSNGEGETINFPGGGISIYQADAQISLIDTYITNNNSLKGGGIAIIGGDTDIITRSLMLVSNTAKNGGGFYCDGSNASLTMYGTSVISSNQATDNGSGNGIGNVEDGGGGVSLNSACSFIMYSDGSIADNIAMSNGGGIKAIDNSIATLLGHEVCSLSGICFGTDARAVSLTNNQIKFTNPVFLEVAERRLFKEALL